MSISDRDAPGPHGVVPPPRVVHTMIKARVMIVTLVVGVALDALILLASLVVSGRDGSGPLTSLLDPPLRCPAPLVSPASLHLTTATTLHAAANAQQTAIGQEGEPVVTPSGLCVPAFTRPDVEATLEQQLCTPHPSACPKRPVVQSMHLVTYAQAEACLDGIPLDRPLTALAYWVHTSADTSVLYQVWGVSDQPPARNGFVLLDAWTGDGIIAGSPLPGAPTC